MEAADQLQNLRKRARRQSCVFRAAQHASVASISSWPSLKLVADAEGPKKTGPRRGKNARVLKRERDLTSQSVTAARPSMSGGSAARGKTGQHEGIGGREETEEEARQRFLLELEFVQCLANPTYIHYLAQNRYFEDEAFVNYLKYLKYFQRPEYAKFIVYPHTFFFLELLQDAHFRTAMAHPANKEVAHRQQFYFWKHYRNNRLKHIVPRLLPEEAPAAPPQTVLAPLPPVKVEATTRSGAGERRKRKFNG